MFSIYRQYNSGGCYYRKHGRSYIHLLYGCCRNDCSRNTSSSCNKRNILYQRNYWQRDVPILNRLWLRSIRNLRLQSRTLLQFVHQEQLISLQRQLPAGSTAGLTFTYFTDAAGTIVLATPTAVAASGTYYIKGTTGYRMFRY